MFAKLVLLLSVIVAVSATLFAPDPEVQKYLWESFKREYGKNYATQDEVFRNTLIFFYST